MRMQVVRHSDSRNFQTWAFWPLLLTILLGAAGCQSTPEARHPKADQVAQVASQLRQLGPSINPAEAQRLAEVAVHKSLQLAAEWQPVQPAWVNNVLVNYGYRNKGLCYEWANDLFLALCDLRPKSLQLHLAVSKMDTSKEHNAVVVTAQGHPFQSGIVLDAWRNGGRVWAGPIHSEKRYLWQPLPPERYTEPIKRKLGERAAVKF